MAQENVKNWRSSKHNIDSILLYLKYFFTIDPTKIFKGAKKLKGFQDLFKGAIKFKGILRACGHPDVNIFQIFDIGITENQGQHLIIAITRK